MPVYFYQPAEDSYLISDCVKKYVYKLKSKKIKVLDMGTGSGFQSKNIINFGIKKENISAADINAYAIREAKKLKISVIKSDLFDKIKNKKFNLIVFNPPYLPEDKYDKEIDTAGGKRGDEIITRFIQDLKSYLLPGGICFLLTSSLTPNSWKKEVKKQKLNMKKIKTKNIFFEKLYVWEIRV